MSRTIEIEISDGTDTDAMMARAQDEARAAGIVIEGDSASGRFRGTADGAYRVEGGQLLVEVTGKPAFVPWGLVESSIRKVFRSD